jgi:CheY-like chemotaxis protein
VDISRRMLRVVIAEDSLVDAELTTRALKRYGLSVDVMVVTTETELRTALLDGPPDIIISDYSMLTMDGKAAFIIARELRPGVPFIFLSGSIFRLAAGTEHADGATACLEKSDIDKLGEVVAKALTAEASPTHVQG